MSASAGAFLLVLLLVLALWLRWRRRHRRMLALGAALPGPPALPVLGNALLFVARPEEQLNKLAELMKRYGQYVRVWLGPDLNVVVKNPADVRYLLTSNKVNRKGPLYDFMTPFIGRGILTGGELWRGCRRLVAPAYGARAVEAYGAAFDRHARELADAVLRRADSFDVYYDVLRATTRCVCRTLMGLSEEDASDIKRLDEVILETQSMYSLIFAKMTRWWLRVPLASWLTGQRARERYFVRIVDEMTSDIVGKRRRALRAGARRDGPAGAVDRLLSAGLPEADVKLQTFSLFTTSQEASAKIASGMLVFLAHLPEWQDKVYREIVEVAGAEDGPLSEAQVRGLRALELVFREALRYLSIAAMIQRTVEEEVSIDNGRITLPVGTSVVIPIHELHRDSQLWDDPLQVKPERFLPENAAKRDPNAFIPFSLGAMDCLGRAYAAALVKRLVVRVVRRARLSADGAPHALPLHVAISVRLARGYRLRAQPRRTEPASSVPTVK